MGERRKKAASAKALLRQARHRRRARRLDRVRIKGKGLAGRLAGFAAGFLGGLVLGAAVLAGLWFAFQSFDRQRMESEPLREQRYLPPSVPEKPEWEREAPARSPAKSGRLEDAGQDRRLLAAALTDPPPWQRYAVAVPAGRGPRIALIIDDIGLSRRRAYRALALPVPLTVAILPYAPAPQKLADDARRRGDEVLVHLPMEPQNRKADPGPNALLTGVGTAELRRRLQWNLSRFSGYVGVNNHMGSRFMQNRKGMLLLIGELARQRLMFLDSRTIAPSLGYEMAQAAGLPAAGRDVFLDIDGNGSDVTPQLREVERIARRTGLAIVIGHPHDNTLQALEKWIPAALARGFVFVPLTAVIQNRAQS